MRRIRFATLLTLAALSAAPLLHAAAWTPTGWDGTLDLSGGSATVSVLIHTDANFKAQRSPIFEVNDGLHTDSGNTAFRMADAVDANTNGNDIGIVRDNAVTTWANGSKTFPTEPDKTYLLSLVYVYDGTRLTVTAYVNGTLIYTGFSTRSEQENLTAQTFQTWPDIPFYTIVSANGYAQALTAGQLAAMAGKGTSDLAAVTPLDVLQADLAALPAAGGTVTLAGDVDASGVGEPIVLDKPVTLVGGGYTLTAPAKGPLFQVKADLTLEGVTIANEDPAGHAIVVGDGTAALAEGAAGQTLTVTGETTIPGGIGVYKGQALTIAGAGTLTVTGAPGCAAIGGSHATPACGDIVIAMTGTLKADGGKDAASIGAGRAEAIAEPTGSITISSGTVNAKHDEMGGLGAAIGGGYNTALKSIAITGGTVNAGEAANVRPELPESTGTWLENTWPTRLTAHVGGAAIGLGSRDPESAHNQVVKTDISITGGTVNAYSRDCGSGIGGAYNASVASIEIGGSAKVYAVGSGGCAPIGGGYAGAGGQSIDINGSAEVIAEVLDYYWQDVEGDVRPEGTASGSAAAYESSYTYSQAAIGGGYGGKAGTIVIGDSAKVLAIASPYAHPFYYWGGTYVNATVAREEEQDQQFGGAGIGSGRFPVYAGEMDAERIVIQDTAQVYAYGGRRGAAIGGGYASNAPGLYRRESETYIYDIPQILPEKGGFPEIVIEGKPTIYAKGDACSYSSEGADIGGGMLMEAVGTITISKEATLYFANKNGNYLGQGRVLDNVDVSFAYGQSVDMQSLPDGMEVPPPTRQTAATNIITLTGAFDEDDRNYNYGKPFYYTNIYTFWGASLADSRRADIVLRLSFAGTSGTAASKLLRVTECGDEEAYDGNLKRNYFLEEDLAEDSPVASIGDQSFVTLEDAFGAVEDGQTITLLVPDLVQPSSKVITVDKDITLDGKGYKLSKGSHSPHFALAAGADLTLKDLTLDANSKHAVIVENGSGANGDNAPSLTIEGTVTLEGGIGVYGDAKLTITGTGALTARGYGSIRSLLAGTYLGYAGIGGAHVAYTGGPLASYADTVCGDIVIAMAEGGSVTATSQAHAAAIGGGYCQLFGNSTGIPVRSGSVTIKSGTVTAYTVHGNSYAASIGSGANTALESIVIEGGTVVAGRKGALWTAADKDVLYGFSLGSSGDHDGKSGGAGGAGIGLARVKDVPQDTVVDTVISITGGDVTAYGVDCGAGIGGAWCVSPKSIAIGGTAKVHAVGQGGCAAIGGGNYGPGLDIDIDGTAEVIAEVNAPVRPNEGQWTTEEWGSKNPSPLPSPDDFGPQAAIGGGYSGESGDITIGGSAKVLAINSGAGTYSKWGPDTYTTDIPVYEESFGGAAIGGGRIPGNKGTNRIVIQDSAQVYAYGGRTGAGIGGGHDSWIGSNDANGNPIRLGTYGNFSPISILGEAKVVAVGGAGASGIGGGLDAQTVNPIVIAHTASVTATPGAQAAEPYTVPDAIGSGSHNPNYSYANQHSPSDTHPGTSPALSLTVTGVTPAEDGSAMLPIVTKHAEEGYVHLTDAAGLTLSVTVGEGAEAQTFTVKETVGSEKGNLISGLILDPEARIDSTPYATLEDAFAAAKANDTITLLKDITRDAIAETITVTVPVTLEAEKNIYIELPGDAQVPYLTLNADLTLDGISLVGTERFVDHPIVVGEGQTVTLTVTGDNLVEGGIGVYDGTKLTLAGAGTLEVQGHGPQTGSDVETLYGNAAIGGSTANPVCGDIVIAMAGTLDAGAMGNAAAIGNGFAADLQDAKGSVTIQSGTVTAAVTERRYYGAGIGGGRNTPIASITIAGGTVTAGTKAWLEDSGDHDNYDGPVGIGAAYCDAQNRTLVDTSISITGGTVTAYGSAYMAAIGGGYKLSVKSISITGGTVTAVTAGGGAAIGCGAYGSGKQAITIGGSAKVIAESLLYRELGEQPGAPTTTSIGPGAAIGGGYAGKAGTIVIEGNAQVLATNAGVGSYTYWGGEYQSLGTYDASEDTLSITGGAAIGTGRIPGSQDADHGSITIQDSAQVWAYGGRAGAGIGGGHDSWISPSAPNNQFGSVLNFPPISILDSAQVVAVGGEGASGIGGGRDAQSGSLITIAHTASVTATPGKVSTGREGYTTPAAIGLGSYNVNDKHSPDQSTSTLVPVSQPTTTVQVTGVTPDEGGSAMLPIVTKNAEEGYVNLTDSPGLTLSVTVGEGAEAQTFTVEETVGSEAGNLISGLILDPEARIGSTPYATLEAAFAAAKANDTITLLKDITRDAIAETITVAVPVTLEAETLTTVTLPGGVETPYLTLNANLTLSNIYMKSTKQPIVHPIVVGEGQTVTLTAKEQNQINGGIGVYDGTKLTLAGDGLLVAWGFGPGNTYGDAAIGGSTAHPACGDIVIAMEGGTLQAIAEANAAAIGSGIVSASASAVQDPKGTITIQAGTVEAFSRRRGYYGACIGGGWNVPVKSISITGGTVTAGVKEWVVDAGDDRQIAGPVGIGVSACGSTSGRLVDTSISITGGTVTAYGSAYMAAIGGGFRVSVKSIEIAGTAEVTAVTAGGAAAIGGGAYGAGGQAITIGGSAKVIAEALLYRKLSEQAGAAATTSTAPGAAIGGGYAGKAGTIVIEGNAQVLATNAGVGSYDYWGGKYQSRGTYDASTDVLINSGAAIGAGRIPSFPKDDLGSITIQDNAQVWAYGGRSGAGIGGGHNSWIDPEDPDQQLGATPNFPPISILGNATVVAKGGAGASGIGGGRDAQVGSLITIAHTADVKAQAGAAAPDYTTPAAIGLGSYNANYQYSPDQRPSTLAPATQPTTTLRVTDATAKDDGSLLLDIVTLDSAGLPEDLTDSPGLALQVEIGETLYAVSKTEGTTEHNEVLKNTFVVNPVSEDSLDVAGSGALLLPLLPLEDTFYLADADGNVVARVDKVGDTTGTITKLDDALTLEPLSIYTKTGNLEKVTAEDAAAILGVEDHDTWVVTQAEDTLSSEVAYVYDFGIAGLTIDKEQGTLTAVTVKMTEGVERAPRNVTLANATLTVYADGTAIATVPAPAFGEDGTLTVTPASTYTIPETTPPTLSVRLTLTEAPAP